MKKTFGRLIIAVLMMAVVLSVAVFADLVGTNYEPEADGTYNITYGSVADGEMAIMVVVKGLYEADATPTISEETVLYVGQVTAGTGGATFAGWKPKTSEPATVYAGSENGNNVEFVGYINNNMIKISGTVGSRVLGGSTYDATIAVTKINTTVATATSENGYYEVYVPACEDGETYSVTISMTNHSSQTYPDRTFTDDTTIKAILDPVNLMAGFTYGDPAYDYHGDGVTDYIDLMASSIAAHNTGSEHYSPAITYSYDGNEIIGTAANANGYAVRQVLSIDTTMFDIPDVESAITLPEGAVLHYYNETKKGDIVTVEIVYYNANPTTNVITISAPLANGVTAEDFAYNTFVANSVAYSSGKYTEKDNAQNTIIKYGYDFYKVAGQTDSITVTNNLTAHISMVEIPVTAGDKVYVQDGSVITANTTGVELVPAAEGYVVVNTGYEAQHTYYIDGKDATLVHTNATVSKDEKDLRDRTKTSDGEDRNGLRFQMFHNPASRYAAGHKAVEVGFITTTSSNKVTQRLENAGLSTDRNLITIDAVAVGAATSGKAYDPNGTPYINKAFNQEDDEAWDIRAVFYNIPITESGVQTVITARPYYKVNDTYIYGEATSATLAQVARAIKATPATWDACTDSMKDYVNEILAFVGETEILDEEVIIDITHLFEALGLGANN